MPYSMTGWGSYKAATFTINIRGLNSKYKEVVLHLPPELFEAEADIYRYLNEKTVRGRLDLFINIDRQNVKRHVKVDEALFTEAFTSLKKLVKKSGLKEQITAREVLDSVEGIVSVQDDRNPGVFSWKKIKPALEAAYEDFMVMKEKEAAVHINDISARLDIIEQEAADIAELFESFKAGFIEKTRQRLEEIFTREERARHLTSEAVEVLEKYNITEELVRISSHIKQTRELLKEKAVGRKLDFLAQEFYREANTTGSKINDSKVSHCVIAIKEATEKIREQAANLE
ncbi:MAG: YicC family protein [Spirochaetia bacterium]|nr:YicC family protein [Spirochaetia bacterium]